ncbi:dynein axonemal intermediate chain 3-like [Microplitis mediator]|uniref:dynein axonemal intermediate chain 3-like n=1 Tax=Microplitis mediator TaxID=375433 RepID=UPI0025523893|nr:dynein axonemal intermediate chain 3-like [Microplitis mediator]
MSEVGSAERPLSWLPDENIYNDENVERIELPYESQRELGCKVGEDVFLEYPWAYVTREEVMRQACQSGSSFECCKDKIGDYKSEWILVGYASSELTSTSFVICLTEEIRDSIVKRNRQVTRKILEKVFFMITKTSKSFEAFRAEEESGKDTDSSRPFFEVELYFNSNIRRRRHNLADRNSGDVRDGAIDLLPEDSRKYNNIFMKQISKAVNTNLKACDKSVQSYLGYPKNKWTQCDDITDVVEPVGEDNKDETARSKTEKQTTTEESSPAGLPEVITEQEREINREISESLMQEPLLEITFPEHLQDAIDCVGYNSKINIISDDIENLTTRIAENDSFNDAENYLDKESCSLINLDITKGKVISDVSWHPNLLGLVAISYVTNPRCDFAEISDQPAELNKSNDSGYGGSISTSAGSSTCALVWSLDEPLKPKLILDDPREINVISFCPSRHSTVVGGAENGQLIFWDLYNSLEKPKDADSDYEIPVIVSSASSDPSKSHLQAVRAIRWLPTDCKITDNGMLEKVPGNNCLQLMTSSEDGTVAIWDLLWQPSLPQTAKNLKSIVKAAMSLTDDLERLDGIFYPHYRLHVQLPKESFNLTVLDFSVPPPEAYQSEETSRKLWFGTAQGEVLHCTWHGQEFEVTGEENCDLLSSVCIHDGPVIRIIRSKHLEEVLLSIGGRIFAIWHDNYIKHPVLWRKGDCRYTACCWSHTPGVFIVARHDGDLETWDIYRKTKQPVHIETISGKLITGLFETQDLLLHQHQHQHQNQQQKEKTNSKFIGICDYNGTFRLMGEPVENESNYQERIEWFRKFVYREVERKKEFHGWQEDYLANDKKALDRKTARAAQEAKRRHEEARDKFLKEQEELARIKAERKAKKIQKSKETILRTGNLEVMKNTLLKKKGFDPRELDKVRHPLVQQEEQKNTRMNKAREKVADKDTYFKHALAVEFPESIKRSSSGLEAQTATPVSTNKVIDELINEHLSNYLEISSTAEKRLEKSPRVPKFDWNSMMLAGLLRKN